ncbi:MAG: hypothetical protein A4E64_01565 [Syntrophorhabdus sp. PtaU1.Bin058]|nr:MAG: hypothetical protein A4E64_01565 [Syntrophorhabdus sp. PtaU1.Bin058]
MKTRYLMIVSVCILSMCCAVSVWAADKTALPQEPMDSLLIAMSTDNTAIFDAAITIGTVALQRGHAVTMLLRVDSIKVAVAKNNYPVGDTTLSKRLSAFMKAGATVIAGGSCMKQMGLTQKDLMEGVMVGTPDLVMGKLFKKDTKILSY